jgi:hypothetical protein
MGSRRGGSRREPPKPSVLRSARLLTKPQRHSIVRLTDPGRAPRPDTQGPPLVSLLRDKRRKSHQKEGRR